jgi:RNA polymerase sigma-70 factor, ECF subfamily
MNSENRNSSSNIKEYEATLVGLFDEYYNRISHYVYQRIGNREDAQDIAGEVFLKALKGLKSYQKQDVPMQGWLFRIAHNLSVDYLRKVNKRRMVPIDSVVLPNNDDPARAAERKVEFEYVSEAMKQLTEEQREVINLRFIGGLTSKEAGGILKKSDGAVREMQRAAIEKLRGIMGVE